MSINRIGVKPGRVLLFTAAAAGALVLAGCPLTKVCSPGDTSAGCQNPPNNNLGTITVTWTVNGQPASTACASANAANVRLSLDNAAPVTVPCATGTYSLTGLSVNQHTVLPSLVDAAGNTINNPAIPAIAITLATGNLTATVNVPFTTQAAGNTGGVAFSWTVGGQPAQSACAASSQVHVESTTVPTGGQAITRDFPCSSGTAQIDGLVGGAWVFKLTLNGAQTPAPILDNIQVSIQPPNVANVAGLDFPSNGGSTTGGVVFAWTVNNGQPQGGAAINCPANATVNIQVTSGPTSPPMTTAACNAQGGATITGLAAGSYNFSLTLVDPAPPSGAAAPAPVTIDGITIQPPNNATISPAPNFECAYCTRNP